MSMRIRLIHWFSKENIMSCKASLLLASVAMSLMILVSGCGPSANLSLRFTPQSSQSFEVTTEVTKDFRFEQPTADKLREEQTTTVITVGFTQTVTSVDDAGVATADVTIDSLKVYMTNKNEVRLSYDSAKESDKSNPLAKLIGQRYSVQLSPEGKVVGYESDQARRAVTGGFEARLAERLVNEEGICERHEIPALWGFGTADTSVKKSWSHMVPSPPGLLAPKNYQKVYTLTGVDTIDGQKVAVVEMKATESAEVAAEPATASSVSMGIFAKMFDSQDDYTGKLLLDTDTGSVLDYDETLVSTYLAHEMPANAAADKGPDTLTMRFTNRVTMKRLK
jgi:hypothetical protein